MLTAFFFTYTVYSKAFHVQSIIYLCQSICYKIVQGFRVTCLFTRQYNTKGYDMIRDVIQLLVGSASCWLDGGITSAIILRPDKYNTSIQGYVCYSEKLSGIQMISIEKVPGRGFLSEEWVILNRSMKYKVSFRYFYEK